MPDGQVQAEDAAEAEAAHDHRVAVLAQFNERVLGAPIPVLPTRLHDIGATAAVAGQLRAMHRVAGAGQAHRHVAHLGRRPTQAVDQENPGLAASKFESGACSGHGRPRLQG